MSLPTMDTRTPGRSRQSPMLALCRTGVTLGAWYCISSAIILTTKWLFVNHFSFPLTVTSFSNTITSVWAFAISRRPCWRPPPLTRKQFLEYVLPIGITTALEIGFSNIALKLLTVSFGTILKGGAPIFTMFWGLLFRVESFSLSLLLALTTIALGIALASMGEGTAFSLTGFVLQLLATALGGLRWAMTHVLLKGDDPASGRNADGSNAMLMSPLTATLYTSPTTAICVLPFAVGLESVAVWDRVNELDAAELRTVLLTMLAVATLVFVLLVSEYWLVHATSSLALSVAGVFKELLTIGGGVYFFKEHISLLNSVGFLICQLGICAYMYLRYDPQATTNAASTQYAAVPTDDDGGIVPPPPEDKSIDSSRFDTDSSSFSTLGDATKVSAQTPQSERTQTRKKDPTLEPESPVKRQLDPSSNSFSIGLDDDANGELPAANGNGLNGSSDSAKVEANGTSTTTNQVSNQR